MANSLTSKQHRLVLKFDRKEYDGRKKMTGLVADLSPRKSDASLVYVLFHLFSEEALQELENRGFDLNTLRFQIDKTPAAIEAHERES